jgi:hypothetical protein
MLLGGLVLSIEEVAVGTELEDEVKRVEEKQNDGGTAREDEDAAVLLVLIAVGLVKNGVKLCIVSRQISNITRVQGH